MKKGNNPKFTYLAQPKPISRLDNNHGGAT